MRERLVVTSVASLGLAASLLLAACDHWPGFGGEGGTSGVGGTTRLEDTSGRLGSSCGSCQGGLTCVTGFPNGVCSKGCQSSSDCQGGLCVLSGYDLLCLPRCLSDTSCRPGYRCASADEGSVCAPGGSSTGGDPGVDAGTD
ncbi:MAG: hypothetical protein EOO75_16930 [Myxococcales bacterium]|nr:MAG: hypothetical protein EOO75_16930 [Myxococcales bacterium]